MTALAITPANVKKISGVPYTKTVKAGVTIAAGEVTTLEAVSGVKQVVLADNDSAALSFDEDIYIAITSSSPGQEVTLMTTGSVLDLGITANTGEFFYLGDSGDLVPYGDLVTYDNVTQVGYFNSDDHFVIQIIKTGVVL